MKQANIDTIGCLKMRAFVNRVEELRQLSRFLKYDGSPLPVFVISGVGGIGKTALRVAFEQEILKPKNVPYAVLDYDADPNLRTIEASLRTIRRQLGHQNIPTPLFDFLYARYFEISTGVKISMRHFPSELENVAAILSVLPAIGNVPQMLLGLTKLGLVVKERLEHRDWFYRLREMEPHELLALLPEVLADDLEETMTVQKHKALKVSEMRIVLLVDGYEYISDLKKDDTGFQRLLGQSVHVLRVVFTRAPMAWAQENPSVWHDKIIPLSSLVNLGQEDTLLLLRKKQITDPTLQDHIHRITGGFPFHVELCIDICDEIRKARARQPTTDDFLGVAQARDLTAELVNRLLRHLKDDERDLMELACYPRWISEDVLMVLSSVPESVSRIFKRFLKLSLFFPHAEIPGAYIMRNEVRDYLLSFEKSARMKEDVHNKLARYHWDRWQKTQDYRHLMEKIYHEAHVDANQAMRIFDEQFWARLKRYQIGEAEGLLYALPPGILPDKERRHLDYAWARFLTETARTRKDFTRARQLYETLIQSADDDNRAAYHHWLGRLLYAMGMYNEALEHLQKSLAIDLSLHGQESAAIALTHNIIGMIYDRQAHYDKALEHLHESLGRYQRLHGENHPEVAVVYNNIGTCYFGQGDYGRAMEYHKKTLDIRMRMLGEEHIDTAFSYNNIGACLLRQGIFDQARDFFNKSLAVCQRVYGDVHPLVAACFNNLGAIHERLGAYDKALEFHHRALEIFTQLFGDVHPHLAATFHNIGTCHFSRGEFDQARHYHEKALYVRLKIYTQDHPDIADSYYALAQTLHVLKEHKAFETINQSIDMYHRLGLEEKAAKVIETLNAWLLDAGTTEQKKNR